MLKDLLEYLAKSLVDDPDAVHVDVTETDTTVVLELSVAKDDVGKV
ncbi:MAG TPA: KH domain-containing protein, partial [Thermoleophilia bacterium]|nr:KH domain-containing protein [Thermoleophilia bacterium]